MHGKMLAAAPWGEPSDEPCAGRGQGDDDDDNDDDDDEEEDESLLTVPTHRALTEPERAILERTPELCVVHARPGDTVAFSSAGAHYAVNGAAEPCACAFRTASSPPVRAHARRALRAAGPVLAGGARGGRLLGAPHGAARATKEMRETARRRAARRRERRGARHGGRASGARTPGGTQRRASWRRLPPPRGAWTRRATRRGPATGRRLPGLPWRRGPRRGERRFSRMTVPRRFVLLRVLDYASFPEKK